jgi:hypothetical protein
MIARQAHNLKVARSNPGPTPKFSMMASRLRGFFAFREGVAGNVWSVYRYYLRRETKQPNQIQLSKPW